MTRLHCDVVNCCYNKDKSCKLCDIRVEGKGAHNCSDTSCGSFAPRGCGCGSTNVCENHKMDTKVACEVVECRFNKGCMCSAKEIGISGGHADKSSQTECASFECK